MTEAQAKASAPSRGAAGPRAPARQRAWSAADQAAGIGRPLQPYDWIRAGLEVLVAQGVAAVRITRLAESLGVTRGSFYWHFQDRDELLRALIEQWEQTNTAAVLAALETAEDLTGGILELFEVWVDLSRFDPGLDSALRDWARHDPTVRRAVESADGRRLAALSKLFARAGFPPEEARVRARVIYFGQVGYYALALGESLAERCRTLETYFQVFTGLDLDPAAAAAFRARHLPAGQAGESVP